MSSQTHLSRCRVLPLGEFAVVIAEPHASLQDAATWRNQWHVIPEPHVTLQGRPTATWWIYCHDPRATSHIVGRKNFIRHTENHFSPYFICFLDAVWALTSGGFRIVSDTLVAWVSDLPLRNVVFGVTLRLLVIHFAFVYRYQQTRPLTSDYKLSMDSRC